MRDSMVFYRSFYEAIKELPLDVQAKVYSAIFEYSLNFNEVVLEGLPKTIFTLIKPQLDANNKRFENGKKGGRKKVDNNQTETKSEPKQNQTETKSEPNVNVNDNVNDNVNVINNNTINFDKLLLFLNSKTKRNFKIINEATKKKYRARIKEGYTSKDIANAIENAVNSDYHKENNFTYLTPEFFSRAETLDKYSNTNNKPKEKNVNKSLIPKGVSFSGPQY